MAGFVLIHGAWHGGWCFDPVTALLSERGHIVAAPDLPGMGGDADALRGVTLEGWAEFTAGICREMRRELGSEPLVLAGHSRGGLVVSATAEADPSAMDGLAYICALMVPDGKSGNDMTLGKSFAVVLNVNIRYSRLSIRFKIIRLSPIYRLC